MMSNVLSTVDSTNPIQIKANIMENSLRSETNVYANALKSEFMHLPVYIKLFSIVESFVLIHDVLR